MKYLHFAICLLFFQNLSFAQKTIALENPSFEDEQRPGGAPVGWTPCGMEGETPCDVQPGQFGCALKPAHGDSYLGMVTRDNHTWESVSQRPDVPLDSGVCYSFTVQLATSANYLSFARLTGEEANYTEPVVFQVWGGYHPCHEGVLLGESPVISHHDWRKYRFIVQHNQKWPLTYLSFQVHYPPGKRCQPTVGNLLVDDLSDLTQTDCPARMTLPEPATPAPGVPDLVSETDLDAFLRKELGAIEYENRDSIQVKYQCLDGGEGRALFYSAHLAAVATALEHFSEKKLMLRTKNAPAHIMRRRAAFLEKYLRKAGLPDNQMDVKALRKDENIKWKLDSRWLNASW